ncbi:MAG: gliding motility protein [Myxococcales bacterium]|nr:gliding motility protein [Myxococcales bacterium]
MTTASEIREQHRRFAAEVAGWLQHADDRAVRDAFDRLAAQDRWVLGALAHLWAPALWRRNRVLFAPLVRTHQPSGWVLDASGQPVRDTKPIWSAPELTAWLDELDRADEIELYRTLYRLRSPSVESWRADLVARFVAATSVRRRQGVLDRLELGLWLDEPTAVTLYEADPVVARPFVLRHLPVWGQRWFRGATLERWPKLVEAARTRGDDELVYELYRRQTPAEEWRRDVVALAKSPIDDERLLMELERRQSIHAGDQMLVTAADVLRLRGRGVMPWVTKHLFGVRRWWREPKGYQALRDLALERGWIDLWGTLVRRAGTSDQFGAEVTELVRRGDDDARARLLALSGVGHEWNAPGFGIATVMPLTDAVAVQVYGRWPELLRGPLRVHVSGGYTPYPKLLEAALASEDDELVEVLASRVVMLQWLRGPQATVLERLTAVFRALPDETFPRRAAAVLGRVPAYAVWSYERLVKDNAFARLLFERSGQRWLDEPAALRELLESPSIHVQHLAFRLLGRDDPRAMVLAADNLDLLLPTLLRPLHTRTRHAALAALGNAARLDAGTAAQVVTRARDALDLPDRKYPKEAVIRLIAESLHRWPDLRRPTEQPHVWGPA